MTLHDLGAGSLASSPIFILAGVTPPRPRSPTFHKAGRIPSSGNLRACIFSNPRKILSLECHFSRYVPLGHLFHQIELVYRSSIVFETCHTPSETSQWRPSHPQRADLKPLLPANPQLRPNLLDRPPPRQSPSHLTVQPSKSKQNRSRLLFPRRHSPKQRRRNNASTPTRNSICPSST